MKVTKKGNLSDRLTWSAPVACQSCMAELEVSIEDVKHKDAFDDQRDPQAYEAAYDYVTCVECSHEIRLELPRFRVPKKDNAS